MATQYDVIVFHTLFSTVSSAYQVLLLLGELFQDDSKRHPGDVCVLYE